MSDLHWYVACVHSCMERKVAERLAVRGVETYVPVRKVRRRWSDRVKTIDRLVLPGLVFIYCDEKTRTECFSMGYGLGFFLVDRTSNVEHKPLIVPRKQMEDFMKVVRSLNGEEDVSVVTDDIAPGDTVRVLNGPLRGFVCECVEIQNRHRLVIRLGMLGSMLVTVEASAVVREEPLKA